MSSPPNLYELNRTIILQANSEESFHYIHTLGQGMNQSEVNYCS